MSDFLKCLLEVIRKNDVVSVSLHFIDALVFLFNETVELLWRNAILTPSVICCLDFHRTQRDDVRTGENPDILAWVAAQPKPPFCVGFAAESENLAENAKAKLAKKKLPLIAANLAQDTMGRDDNTITLYDAKGEHALGHGSKLDLARRLIEQVANRLK